MAAKVFCVIAAMGIACQPAAAQSLLKQLGGVDGNAVATVKYGNTLYVGGYFERAGQVTGACVATDTCTGALVGRFPEVRGEVNAVASDGYGGWFLGGTFTAIDGVTHGGLAHVDAGQRLVTWDPAPDGDVLALATSGDTLFAAGTFQHVWGTSRPYLAAFRIRGGELLDPLPTPDGPVRALLVDQARLYVGGDSQEPVSGSHGPLFAYDLERWDSSVWQAQGGGPGLYGSVYSLALSGHLLFLGGTFAPIGQPGVMNVGAVNTLTGVLDAWNPSLTGPNDSFYGDVIVNALAVRDTSVYVGGHFAWVNGLRRGGLAKIGFPSGLVSEWNPDPGPWFADDVNRDVSALLLRGQTLYLAGQFEAIGDSARSYLAAVHVETGAVLPWQPGANHHAKVLAENDGTMVVAGRFHGTGAEWRERRSGLAAFDLATGRLKPWNPQLSGLGVNTLAASAGNIYVGGYFDSLGGQRRYCLGAVDTLLGGATDWDPGGDGPVITLRAIGDTLYVGGGFTTLAGQPRNNIGAFETTGGSLLGWAPSASDAVRVIEPAGRRIFVGGDFMDFNGVRRPGLVAVDVTSGALEPFDCGLTFPAINALVASGDTLYAGGVFLAIGGKTQRNLAALDATTGTAFDWRADPTGQVTGIVKLDSTLFVSGTFGSIAGHPRIGLAALSSATGAVLPWEPGFNSTVWGLSAYDGTLYAGGSFTEALGVARSHLAGLHVNAAPPEPPITPSSLAFSPIWPNPASDQISLELAMPSADRVSLALFDIQGRLVAPVMSRQPVPAGRHLLTAPVAVLAKGFYLCQIRVGERTATRKFLVVR